MLNQIIKMINDDKLSINDVVRFHKDGSCDIASKFSPSLTTLNIHIGFNVIDQDDDALQTRVSHAIDQAVTIQQRYSPQ